MLTRSALMKPRSKSVWMVPAAREAVSPARTVQARASFSLKVKKVQQLGELVTSTGADALDLDTLAGALLAAVESASTEEKEAWRAKGSAFFQRRGKKARG